MLDDLLHYYERELGHLRELSAEFARRYPRVAGRLQLEGDQCEDPHVERLIEAFAFLAARIHRKLDDEYPQITASLLDVLYPHYLQPIPAASIVQFEVDPGRPEIARRYRVEARQTVLAPAVDDVACRFRSCYPVELYPLSLQNARLALTSASGHLARMAPDAAAVLTLEFETHCDIALASIGLRSLRFFLDGEPSLMHLLYRLLLQDGMRLRLEGGDGVAGRELPPRSIRPVGFERDEGLLDYDDRSFLGYRLLTEYFTLPEKFLFIDIVGLEQPVASISGNRLVIHCLLPRFHASERHLRLLEKLEARHFRLGCTPVVNLFAHAAEPLRLTHQRESYPVVVDARRPLAYEIIRVERVQCIEKSGNATRVSAVPPLYAVEGLAAGEPPRFHWHASREGAIRPGDRGTELALHLVDTAFSPLRPASEVLSVELLCSNRDLPERIPFGGSQGGAHTEFSLPGHAVVKRVRLLRKPTPSLRPPPRKGLQWRLISHLSLNYLSIVEQGKGALQEMLALYNPVDKPAARRQIEGIRAVASAPAVARLAGPDFSSFVRGTAIDLLLDEECYVGGSAYLFASVLERFFALYCAPNSFTRLRLRTVQDEEAVCEWPARSGEAIVI